MRISAFMLVMLISSAAAAQPSQHSPPQAILALVRAMYANDDTAFRAVVLPNSKLHLLTTGGSPNAEGLRDLESDPGGLQIIPKRGFEHRGNPVKPDAAGRYPVGTTAVFMVAHHRSPLVVILEQTVNGWKVDPRWWIAMVEMTSGTMPRPETAEFAARALIASMIAMDTSAALQSAAPGADAQLLFAGAPRQREPSGHLDALAQEMPIVEIARGGFYSLPSGAVVEGSTNRDRKLLVGLMGSVEIPFVMVKTPNGWKVEPQPYFALILR